MPSSRALCGLASVKKQNDVLDCKWIFTVLTTLFFRSTYNKTIIRFGFCDIQNDQGLGKIISNNSYLDHKRLFWISQNCWKWVACFTLKKLKMIFSGQSFCVVLTLHTCLGDCCHTYRWNCSRFISVLNSILLTFGFDSESKNFLLSPLGFVSFCAEWRKGNHLLSNNALPVMTPALGGSVGSTYTPQRSMETKVWQFSRTNTTINLAWKPAPPWISVVCTSRKFL